MQVPVLVLVVLLGLGVLLTLVFFGRMRREGLRAEAGLVLVPMVSERALGARRISPKKAIFDTRSGGRLVARVVASGSDELLLRRGRGPVFRRRCVR